MSFSILKKKAYLVEIALKNHIFSQKFPQQVLQKKGMLVVRRLVVKTAMS
jgi:hypothetical protein